MKQIFPYLIKRICLFLGCASDSLNSTQYEAMYILKIDGQGFNCRNATAVQDFQSIRELNYLYVIVAVMIVFNNGRRIL
jgi:hypothetical protein